MRLFFIFLLLISSNSLAQVSFSRDKSKTQTKNDSLKKGEGIPYAFKRSDQTNRRITSEDHKNAIYKYNGEVLSKHKKDSLIKLWVGVMIEMDGSLDTLVMNISPASAENIEQFKQLREEKKANFESKSAVGKTAPLFSVHDLKKNSISLSDLKGKIIVLNFWFIGCAPCRKEMPQLNELVDKYKSNDNVVFLALALDKEPELIKFLERNKFDYLIIPDTKEIAYGSFGIAAFPTHIVIDQNGIMSFVAVSNDEKNIIGLDKEITRLFK